MSEESGKILGQISIDGLCDENNDKLTPWDEKIQKPSPNPPVVALYTDGACSGNPGPGGWAFVLLMDEDELFQGSGGHPDTTNNRMELTGAIEGLSALREKCKVTLYSDSKYVVDGLRLGWAIGWRKRGWKKSDGKPALNVDLWQRLLERYEYHEVTPVWVKGHDTNEWNNQVDRAAVERRDYYANVHNIGQDARTVARAVLGADDAQVTVRHRMNTE